jgi:hypothetical protein
LNWDQIELWKPPENPAKETDSRFASYEAEFGDSSWELDAVEPAQLADLIKEEVYSRRDTDLWDEAVERENEMRSELEKFSSKYGEK